MMFFSKNTVELQSLESRSFVWPGCLEHEAQSRPSFLYFQWIKDTLVRTFNNSNNAFTRMLCPVPKRWEVPVFHTFARMPLQVCPENAYPGSAVSILTSDIFHTLLNPDVLIAPNVQQ